MKNEEKTAKELRCLCGIENCGVGMKINNMPEGKVKIQIINSKDIDSIIVNKFNLIKILERIDRKQIDNNYIQISSLIPKNNTILDLGCGCGSPFVGTDFPLIVGVDIWKNKFDMPEYDEVYFNDVREIDKLFPENSFDVVTCIDFIEHLTKEDGLKLIEDAEKIALFKVIFFTPKKWTENKEAVENKNYWSYGNKYNYHKSHWTEEDFISRGYEIIPNKNYVLAQKAMR